MEQSALALSPVEDPWLANAAPNRPGRPSIRRTSPTSRARAVARSKSTAWAWGDPFPEGTTDCDWTMEGWIAPLLDPSPCVYSDGTVEDSETGWRFLEGSTSVTVLQDGTYRMYFSTGNITHQDADKQFEVWPVTDPGGRSKFTLDANGNPIGDPGLRKEWWGASGSEVEDLYFSADFISFIDSADGVSYPLYTPHVDPDTAAACEDIDYAGASVTYEFSGFRAGWRSTVIPSSGASVVYRDPSVVYIDELGKYVMMLVSCDGRGLATDGGDLVEGESGCSFCTPEGLAACSTSATTPVTNLVFFTCPDAAFQDDVMGPFPLLPVAPDPALGQWAGVPQMLLSPGGTIVLWYLGTRGYAFAGLHGATTADFAAHVMAMEAVWTDGADMSAWGPLVYTAFHNFGFINLEADEDCPNQTLTDEHLVFCKGGRLNLYYTNRSTGVVGDPLDLISRAFAASDWDETVVREYLMGVSQVDEGAVSRVLDSTSTYEEALAWYHGSGAAALSRRFGGSAAVAIDELGIWLRYALADEGADAGAHPNDMLVNFQLAACDPINIVEYLGTSTVDRVDSGGTVLETITVEANDPDVYLTAHGMYALVFHSRAMGGTVIATASPAVACDTEVRECTA